MLFHVAICDDMPVDILMLENKIKESNMGKVLDLKYNRFIKGEDLLKAVRSGKKYDLVILDISLKGLNGEEIAIKLRDAGYDSLLVFCTAGNGPSVNSFKSGPYRFLLKSFTGKEIISELDGIFKELVQRKIQTENSDTIEEKLIYRCRDGRIEEDRSREIKVVYHNSLRSMSEATMAS